MLLSAGLSASPALCRRISRFDLRIKGFVILIAVIIAYYFLFCKTFFKNSKLFDLKMKMRR